MFNCRDVEIALPRHAILLFQRAKTGKKMRDIRRWRKF